MLVNRLEISFLKTSEITDAIIDEIIEVKQYYWNYTKEEHRKWIDENIFENDYHLLLKTNNVLVGYLNVANISIFADNVEMSVYGVGNVCVVKNYAKQGLGSLLMNILNYYMDKLDKPSILLCKDSLVYFYSNLSWKKYEGKVSLSGEDYKAILMYNKNIVAKRIDLIKSF